MAGSVLRESRVLETRAADVRRFRDAFTEVLALMDAELDDLAGRRGCMPSPGNQREFDDRVLALGETAAVAVAAAGPIQNGVTRLGRSYNPLLQWRDPLTFEGGLASSEEVIDSCNFVIGVLTQRLVEAQAVEGTAAYRLGRLLTFPERARAASRR